MPSRRATIASLASLVTVGTTGCGSLPPAPPSLDGLQCPPVDLEADAVTCGTATDAPVTLRVDGPRRVSTDPKSLMRSTVDIVNDSDRPFQYRRSRWRLFRNDGFGWDERSLDGDGDDDVRTVDPGTEHGYLSGLHETLSLGADGPTPRGTYALVVPGSLDGGRRALVATFRVGE